MSFFKSISDTFRELGFVSGSVYLLDQALRRLDSGGGIYFYDWMVQPISEQRLLSDRRAKNYTHRVVKKNDPILAGLPIRPEIIEHRFDQNAECIILTKDENVVGFIWLVYGAYVEDEVRINFCLEPEEKSAFDLNLYIFPKYRLGSAFAAIWDVVNRYLYERGVRYSFSRITHTKRNSFNSHSRLGSTKVGGSLTIKLFDVELTITSRPRRVFLSLTERKRLDVCMEAEGVVSQENRFASGRQP